MRRPLSVLSQKGEIRKRLIKAIAVLAAPIVEEATHRINRRRVLEARSAGIAGINEPFYAIFGPNFSPRMLNAPPWRRLHLLATTTIPSLTLQFLNLLLQPLDLLPKWSSFIVDQLLNSLFLGQSCEDQTSARLRMG